MHIVMVGHLSNQLLNNKYIAVCHDIKLLVRSDLTGLHQWVS